MEIEDHNMNFSPNDPQNVYMPDSLGPIAFEFLESFKYILKDCGENKDSRF
jgi:hypothetical protein